MDYRQIDDVYVLGCGPSLKGFRWAALQGKMVIAINASLADFPSATYFLTADSWIVRYAAANQFWKSPAKRILVMQPDHPHMGKIRNKIHLFHVICPSRFDGQIGFEEKDFATGQNSGFCGMQLAVLFRPKRIHLLGIDLHTRGGDHYHSRHSVGASHLDEYYHHFVTATGILWRHGTQVISHSESSRLNSHIPFVRLEE